MSKQEQYKNAQELYKKKKYADVLRTVMQHMQEGDYSRPVLLLSAKAWIGLSVTDSGDKVWSNLYSTIDSLMDDVISAEDYRQLRREIEQARHEAERDYFKLQLKKLEKNPTLDQFQENNSQSMMHFLFLLKASSTMTQHPKVKALMGNAADAEVSVSNPFTDEEKSRYNYDAGTRIFDKAKATFETNGCGYNNALLLQTATAMLTSKLLWKEATEKLSKEPQELHIMRLEKNQSMIAYMLQLCRRYQVLTPNGVREWEADQSETKRKLNKAKEALEQKKKKEARIAAYWKEHPGERKSWKHSWSSRKPGLRN